jgi:hypothetical protein
LNALNLSAQKFDRLGNGLQYKTFFHQQNIQYQLCETDALNRVYHVYYDTVTSGFNFGKEYTQIRLKIFDGIAWRASTPLLLYSKNSIDAPRILDIQMYKNEIYVCGSFDSSSNNLGAGIVKWSSGLWQTSGVTLLRSYSDYFEVTQMHVFGTNSNESMLICGNFDSIPNERVNGLMILNNSNWSSIGSAKKGFQNLSNTDNVFFYGSKDSLYAFNKNKIKPDSIEIGGANIKKLGIYRQNQFEELNVIKENISAITEFQNQLALIYSGDLFYIRGLQLLKNNNFITYDFDDNDSFYSTNYVNGFEFDNKLYLFFQKPNFGIKIYEFDGIRLQYLDVFKISDNYIKLEMCKNKEFVFLSGNFKSIQSGNYSDSANQIVQINFAPMTSIHAVAFEDLNFDKIKQSNEKYLSDVFINSKELNLTQKTNGSGICNFQIPVGSGGIFEASSNHGYLCNSNHQLVNSVDSVYVYEFPFQSEVINDVSIHLTCGTGLKVKQGFISTYNIETKNKSNEDKTIEIEILYNKKLSDFVYKGFSPDAQKPGVFKYKLNIQKHSQIKHQFTCRYQVDSFELGEIVQVDAILVDLDDNIKNNKDSLVQKVVSAHDPNIKVAIPSSVVDVNDEIKYIIHFENLGNDVALNVIVVDTFQSLLDIRKVVLGGCSHSNYSVEVKNNCVIWQFSGINLPSKMQDSTNNKGFVTFISKLSNNAKKGDSIMNQAAIFFDYQNPVITNEAIVKLKDIDEIANIVREKNSYVYPNPGNRCFQISDEEVELVELFEYSGRLLKTIKKSEDGKFYLLEGMSEGLYILRFNNQYINYLIKY